MMPNSMYATYLSDPDMAHLSSEERFIGHMLTFERALARMQGRLGMIPTESAKSIDSTLATLIIRPESLAEGTAQNGVPTIPLLAQVRAALPDAVKPHLHWGATSQDVMDTAQVLICQEAIALLEGRLQTLLANLSNLQTQYSQLFMMGRTRTQQALPIRFGHKISTWQRPLLRHIERLEQLKPRLLLVQLGGAVGDRAAFGEQGEVLARALADELGLGYAPAWHTERDGLTEFTNWLALLTGTLGKLGQDILIMGQTEIGEVVENKAGGGKSSSMPHKNNPVLSEALVALARQNAQFAALQLQSLVHGNERDATAWLLEWENLPRMLVITGTSLRHAISIAQTMGVNEKKAMSDLGFGMSDLLTATADRAGVNPQSDIPNPQS